MNVFEKRPAVDKGPGKRVLIDEEHLFLRQLVLGPGDSIPRHRADSNVYLLLLEGQISLEVDKEEKALLKGSLFPVRRGDSMRFGNFSKEEALLLIFKAPNPRKAS